MKTFYFTRRRLSGVFSVQAKTAKQAWKLLDQNGGRRIDYTRTNSSGTPVYML